MFVAWRDPRFAKGRFALMGAVIMLITVVVGRVSLFVFRVWSPITTVSGPFRPDTPSGSSNRTHVQNR